jgi:toxin ParE1/3/4
MGIYKLSKASETDLEEIFEYGIFRFGLDQAKTYVIEMEQHFKVLAENVNLGRDASLLAVGLKRFNCAAHVIFYLPITNGILVVRILHQSRDFERHL